MIDKFKYHDRMAVISKADEEFLRKKDRSYGASWKESGRSAWFMCKRMIDRLTNMMARPKVPDAGFNLQNVDDTVKELFHAEKQSLPPKFPGTMWATAQMMAYLRDCFVAEDLLAMLEKDMRALERVGDEAPDGTALAVVRDLRRYLLLAEAEVAERCDWVVNITLPCPPTLYKGHGGGGGDPLPFGSENVNAVLVTAPWMVNAQWRRGRVVEDVFDRWWEPRGLPNLWKLRECVETAYAEVPPSELLSFYAIRTNEHGNGTRWVLDVSLCPAELRSMYRKIQAEVNEVELRRLPEWIQAMYAEVPGAEKWRVLPPNEAWTRW